MEEADEIELGAGDLPEGAVIVAVTHPPDGVAHAVVVRSMPPAPDLPPGSLHVLGLCEAHAGRLLRRLFPDVGGHRACQTCLGEYRRLGLDAEQPRR